MADKVSEKILLLQTNSLDKYLKLKYQLDENNIFYQDKIKNDSIMEFAAKMISLGRPATGVETRNQTYRIYIDKNDYAKASTLVEE
ncbi:hypothetical protein [Hespellia stercorisuis]|uniref:Signal transducing protein n=1 Tax=Hespellia stercorisuis DSM 15480 TaxID=1121950 RepID=A0A1M6V969_9FIRM|nr:hypothetical protein [Hespellia stercorisuis]SHK78053.1 hypothetical protein SAMN02745243_03712 [Hespellia stercorisuis DSM 15480]